MFKLCTMPCVHRASFGNSRIVRDKYRHACATCGRVVGAAWASVGTPRARRGWEWAVSYWNSFTLFRLSCRELCRVYNYTDLALHLNIYH